MKNRLLRLVTLKWISELIYFVEIVYIIGTMLILLIHDIAKLSLPTIHLISLIALFIYVIIGFLVTNNLEKMVLSVNYFKIVSSLAYISIISFFQSTIIDYLIQPYLTLLIATPFLFSYFFKRYYKVLMYNTLFNKEHNVDIKVDFTNTEELKNTMTRSISNKIEQKYKNKVKVVGRTFTQDGKGEVKGVFDIVSNQSFLGFKQFKLTTITLIFNIDGAK